jgi:hypothetical protein
VRTRWAIVTGCALLAIGSACSSAKQHGAPPSTSTKVRAVPATTRAVTGGSAATTTTAGAASGSTTTAAPTTTTTPAASLASLILDTVPSGYERQPDDVGQTGPTNLAQAALDDVSPTARRALLVTGFVNGYQRQWTSSDGYTIDQVFLYQFSTPKGAQGYAQHWHDTLLSSNAGGPALQSFTPAFLPPGALGLQGQDKSGSTAVVMFAAGNYAVEATVNGGVAAIGDAPADQSGPATSLALAQYQRLP